MEQKFSLDDAGKLFGVTANAMRARAKKTPEKYRMERDNSGKIWLWIDPQMLSSVKTEEKLSKGSKRDELKASLEAFKVHTETVAALRERLAAETARADAAEADRDRWQVMAEKLAERPRRGWWPWR